MIIKKIKIPIYEQTLYVSVTEDYSKNDEHQAYLLSWIVERVYKIYKNYEKST